MSLIIETDLGHDPDDLFTILWLMAVGVDISAIVITPGDPDQIAIARFVCEETGRNHILIGASKLGRTKLSSGSVHRVLLHRYGRGLIEEPDGLGIDVIIDVIHSGDEMLVIGPLANVGTYLAGAGGVLPCRATMQGGFVPYSVYQPTVVLDSFLGKDWMQTFNLNGDRRAAERFLAAPFPRQMTGKNVCHTIVFDPEHQIQCFAPPPNRAAELFLEAAALLGHTKKFHDPVAAVCHLHPEVGVWIDGKTVKRDAGWTTVVPGEDKVLVDIDRDAFWKHLYTWS